MTAARVSLEVVMWGSALAASAAAINLDPVAMAISGLVGSIAGIVWGALP